MVQGVTLDEVWGQMVPENRASVATAVVDALSKLHSLRIDEPRVWGVLQQGLKEGVEIPDKATMGGPLRGFLSGGRS